MPPKVDNEPLSDIERLEQKMDALLLAVRASRLGPDHTFQFLCRDNLVKMHLPFADVDFIQRYIITNHAFYEHKSLQQVSRFITPDSVVLDAGANIGNHTIFFAMICRAREVISFEVMRETFKLLERNVQLNQLQNVRLHNQGLGARDGHAGLKHYAQANLGAASLKAGGGDGDYAMTTVDGLGLKTLDFMKVDVEGSHLDLLEGAKETIARCKPRIWLELRPQKDEREEGEAFMKSIGYRVLRELSHNDVLFEPG